MDLDVEQLSRQAFNEFVCCSQHFPPQHAQALVAEPPVFPR
jgi:hypothetical protein